MGGSAPLGYEPDGRTLKIKEGDARTVRTLFEIYIEQRSLIETTREAEKVGLRSTPRKGRRHVDVYRRSDGSLLPIADPLHSRQSGLCGADPSQEPGS